MLTLVCGRVYPRFAGNPKTVKGAPAGSRAMGLVRQQRTRQPLYTDAERRRRDASSWTLVQGVLAPLQFIVFLVSLGLVVRALTNDGWMFAASLSVAVKTAVLYTIMVTGSLWEKDVFGKYLFAPAFFWEDAVSFLVIALHTAYLVALFTGWMAPRDQLILALVAYATYVFNAGQFLLKLRAARLGRQPAFDAMELAR
jgi:3-vinyl bacteriochlorophyllide hydratase